MSLTVKFRITWATTWTWQWSSKLPGPDSEVQNCLSLTVRFRIAWAWRWSSELPGPDSEVQNCLSLMVKFRTAWAWWWSSELPEPDGEVQDCVSMTVKFRIVWAWWGSSLWPGGHPERWWRCWLQTLQQKMKNNWLMQLDVLYDRCLHQEVTLCRWQAAKIQQLTTDVSMNKCGEVKKEPDTENSNTTESYKH